MGCYQLERRLEDGAALRLAALRAPGRRRARAFGSRGWSGVYGSICMWHDGQPIYVGGAIAGLSAYINHLLEIIPRRHWSTAEPCCSPCLAVRRRFARNGTSVRLSVPRDLPT